MGNVLKELFQWPEGIVVGNLIASVMWATPTFLHMHHKLNKQHQKIEELHHHLIRRTHAERD